MSRVSAAAIDQHTASRLPQLLLGLGLPIVILIYMFKFPQSYPDRVTHQPGTPAH